MFGGYIMIDKKDFNNMKKDLVAFDKKREEVIALSRDIIKLSKLSIYALHRDDPKTSTAHLASMKKLLKKLPRERYDTDISRVARQEYVEAALYHSFVTEGKIATRKEIDVGTTEYLLGVCDLTGELMRKSVKDKIRGNKDSSDNIRKVIDEIYGLFLEFDLRNGELRKKSDQIKWNLSKLEDMALK